MLFPPHFTRTVPWGLCSFLKQSWSNGALTRQCSLEFLSFSGFSFLPFCIPRSATCIKSQFPAGNPLFTFSSSVVLSTAVPASLKGVVWAWEVHPCSEEICMSQGLPTQGAPLSLQPSLRQTGEVVLEYALLTL